ncbi:TetR/AcrR family transcriptional regulator [Glaciihabitans sp. UYNi722]|uniref:TetR/AcrR family transcriptional regulator n=1 Tax=Glaciihabitans sp. UYNi722 TaxID=3156344 RepID=UPI003396F371
MPIVDSDPVGQRAPWPTLTHKASSAPAKRRILETANTLFYGDGIRSVGVDRLISESGVTKATFYKHYGSKDRLIVEYITGRDLMIREFIETIIANAPTPEHSILALVDMIVTAIEGPGFRGCPFINAASEFTDPRHPVRQVVADHREWYAERVGDVFRAAGHPLPGDAGDEFILARDGAMTGGYAGDSIAATTALQRAVERIIADTHR